MEIFKIAIAGNVGSGKTTFIRSIQGLLFLEIKRLASQLTLVLA